MPILQAFHLHAAPTGDPRLDVDAHAEPVGESVDVRDHPDGAPELRPLDVSLEDRELLAKGEVLDRGRVESSR